uniref:HVA22-like protein n=1 Tax=Tetraselmis sp. GSL018 TaxID=582737 RepID=A0A061RTM4_9CHLO
MLGDFSSRLLVNIFGYVYPAYLCFKSLEQRRQDKTREWFVLALWTAFERVADMLIFWIPLYYEAKVISVILLWHPKTQGAQYLYETMLQPWLHANQAAIDSHLERGQAWITDKISANLSRALGYVQHRAHEAIAYMQQVAERQQQEAARLTRERGGHNDSSLAATFSRNFTFGATEVPRPHSE